MTRSEIDSFYRAFDTAEKTRGTDVDKAVYYADLALEEDRADMVAVVARVAFRFAIQAYYAAERARTEPTRRQIRRTTRTERLQGLADRGIDTWEEYRGER